MVVSYLYRHFVLHWRSAYNLGFKSITHIMQQNACVTSKNEYAGRPAGVGGRDGGWSCWDAHTPFSLNNQHLEETRCKGTKTHLTNSWGCSAGQMEDLVWTWLPSAGWTFCIERLNILRVNHVGLSRIVKHFGQTAYAQRTEDGIMWQLGRTIHGEMKFLLSVLNNELVACHP